MNDNDPFDQLTRQENRTSVATLYLVAFLLVILAWEAQFAVLILHYIGGIGLHVFWRIATTALCLLATVFAIQVGRANVQHLFMSHGKIELSRTQTLIVTLIIVSICTTIAVVHDLLD
ncbi:hypothetical protein [Neorhodopirellula lusitana]|uniref:hypothetical protein n=1 Tax=Neorhodopirellula lusitana TaxID=445327 RepID=UPI0038511DC8